MIAITKKIPVPEKPAHKIRQRQPPTHIYLTRSNYLAPQVRSEFYVQPYGFCFLKKRGISSSSTPCPYTLVGKLTPYLKKRLFFNVLLSYFSLRIFKISRSTSACHQQSRTNFGLRAGYPLCAEVSGSCIAQRGEQSGEITISVFFSLQGIMLFRAEMRLLGLPLAP